VILHDSEYHKAKTALINLDDPTLRQFDKAESELFNLRTLLIEMGFEENGPLYSMRHILGQLKDNYILGRETGQSSLISLL